MESKPVPLTRDCVDGRTCPGVIATDKGIVVRGSQVAASEVPGIPLGDGEAFVIIPPQVFEEAARAYSERAR
jgi:hypothetical protein